MKLRALACALLVVSVVASVANCGSDNNDNPTQSADGGSTGSIGFPTSDSSVGDGQSQTDTQCKPLGCADVQATCGPAGDGCGGVIQCGTCTTGTCGGGGTPSQCGGPSACVPKKCTDIGVECGPAGDGCGGQLDCGSCTAPQECGFGGPSKCGGGRLESDGGVVGADGGACVPRTTCNAGECGPVANGCGGLLQCNGCGPGEICGAVTPSMCGPICVKQTCGTATCGYVADGCGGIVNCGGTTCPAGQMCGLAGPNMCGDGKTVPDAGSCVNFCVDQQKNATCTAGTTTSILGTVYAPNGTLPIPGATVYIPNGSKTSPYGVATFTDGTANGTCDQCEVQAGSLLSTTTAFDGSFRLDGVPPEVDFPIVIQLGRWRRMVTIPARTRCSTTQLTTAQTRFPTKENEGSPRDNIPLIAVSTGSVDGLECVLFKLGIDRTMFSNPVGVATNAGTGRIRLYSDDNVGTSQGGATIDSNTPHTDEALTNSDANLNQYDAIIFGCSGAPNLRPAATNTRVQGYANRGGRVFATHYNYTYLYENTPWDTSVTWDTANERKFDTTNATINTAFPKGALFAQWLGIPIDPTTQQGVGALSVTSPPEITLQEARNNADLPMGSGSEEWMVKSDDPPGPGQAVLHYTFNTPYGAAAANQCGRVLFSDFHVSTDSTAGKVFPAECGGLTPPPLSAQETALAFFLFDLTSCIQPDTGPTQPTCHPATCASQNIACGLAGDGCGGQLSCPACGPGQLCQGNPAACITPSCTPTTCALAGANCGTIADGCGKTLDCGTCTGGLSCGGNGPNQCGANSCASTTCSAQNIGCGPAGDGCGNLLDCGPCPAGQTCGGGGTPSQCGAPNCTKRTCAGANAECGPIADGCGGLVDCGQCPTGTVCGYGGTPNRCGVLPTK